VLSAVKKKLRVLKVNGEAKETTLGCRGAKIYLHFLYEQKTKQKSRPYTLRVSSFVSKSGRRIKAFCFIPSFAHSLGAAITAGLRCCQHRHSLAGGNPLLM